MATRGKGARNKGSNYERKIAKKLLIIDPKAKRMPLSGADSQLKGDILTSLPILFECKKQENWNPIKYYEQAVREAKEEGKSRMPVVVMGKNRSEDFALLSLDDFLLLLELAIAGGWYAKK